MSRNKATPPRAQNNRQRTEPEPKHWLEYAIFAFVVLTTLATAAAACFTGLQWRTAADQERRQLRAYIGAVDNAYSFGMAPPSFSSGAMLDVPNLNDVPSAFWKSKNYGQTPAYHVFVCGGFVFIDTNKIRLNDIRHDRVENCSSADLTKPNNIMASITTMWPLEERYEQAWARTSESMGDIIAGNAKGFLFIRIRYDDVFGFHHNTYICQRFAKSKGGSFVVIGCSDGNGGEDD